MQTKYEHTRGLLPEKSHHIIELFFEFAQLKNLYRQGWLKRDISRLDCESVAEHSYSVALLGYVLAEECRPDLDSQRVMKLGLFHDVGEIYAGDITPVEGISPEEKSVREHASVAKVFSKMPSNGRYGEIWMEYERQETPEAQFVKQIDRLETALQANLYKRLRYDTLDGIFNALREQVTDTALSPILDELVKTRQQALYMLLATLHHHATAHPRHSICP
jgi:putative hydrolases of HD superfamily